MAITNGTLILFKTDDNGTATAVAHQQDVTLTTDRELPDATTKDSDGHEEHLENAGLISEEITADGLAEFTEDGNFAELHDLIYSRQDVNFTLGTDTYQISGKVGCSNVEITGSNEEAATLSGSYKVNGKVTKEVVS